MSNPNLPIFILEDTNSHLERITNDIGKLGYTNPIISATTYTDALSTIRESLYEDVQFGRYIFDRTVPQYRGGHPQLDEGLRAVHAMIRIHNNRYQNTRQVPPIAIWTDSKDTQNCELYQRLQNAHTNVQFLPKEYTRPQLTEFLTDTK